MGILRVPWHPDQEQTSGTAAAAVLFSYALSPPARSPKKPLILMSKRCHLGSQSYLSAPALAMNLIRCTCLALARLLSLLHIAHRCDGKEIDQDTALAFLFPQHQIPG